MGNAESKPRRKQRSTGSESSQTSTQSLPAQTQTQTHSAAIKASSRPKRTQRPASAHPAVPIPTKSFQEKSALMNRLVTPAQPCSARVTYIKPVTVSPDDEKDADIGPTAKAPVVVATEIPSILTPEDSPKYLEPSEAAPFGKLHVGAQVAEGLQGNRRDSDNRNIVNSKIQLRDDSPAEDDEDDSEDYYYKNNLTYGLKQLKLGTDVANMNIEVVGQDAVSKPLSRVDSGDEVELRYQGHDDVSSSSGHGPRPGAVRTKICYKQGGNKAYITGTFTGWRKMLPMDRQSDGTFSVTLDLPEGTHRFRFVIDGELKCADDIGTATDSSGFLVNYLDVGNDDSDNVPASFSEENIPLCREGDLKKPQTTSATQPQTTHHASSNHHSHGDDGITQYEDETPIPPPLEYTNEIPSMFLTLDVAELDIPESQAVPPHLPPHLDTVILNTNSNEKDDSSVLPAPNHVVLNHLATSSIKHNVLAVASVNRYGKKFVTQILHAPMPSLN
ncbi:5'-AMP-activated protein kinase beta subunit, interation domain-domain-containing protein [Yarrowia lipolytica]|uniref:YALI0C00429p n=3 Tax=Yarrowia lipolytica TaxID=4952 RepID=Q6CDH7_YARLI|nr:YALI0C00429p [Yarrowia lipolytica CLIB122]AOW02143.1 hypothetical protein YALI1_C00503g [Yarrowia lipolytica]KAB8281006.1 5'-AMP-activated protein kinase beta subunit, interation domain-containing protein [Yarrowia lipolytica]KAJ8052905.1 5'-AMP-activated protein kinase beta subunit, interation domain-containing protein [Yarrowia lipolytica]QNP96356.1 SNF1 protein kinase subunit beta-2 [Yarrowia lipolytica]RDW25287.1 5'-AMP-activated protein kinase beta subunit, interation domain-domain-con|eukprot:XP_501285.1 YALI0C00429p [Yarrowia lipolytica CLIB122]